MCMWIQQAEEERGGVVGHVEGIVGGRRGAEAGGGRTERRNQPSELIQ